MITTFYAAAVVAIVATALAISQKNVVHGLLYLIVSLLAVALIFFVVGAPFVAALEVIIYAGAIMVLFVFVMMLLNLGPQTVEQEQRWLTPRTWIGPLVLTVVLLAELLYALASPGPATTGPVVESASRSGSSCSVATRSRSNWRRCCCSPASSVPITSDDGS